MDKNYVESKAKLLDLYGSVSIREFLGRESYYEIGEIQKVIIADMEAGFKEDPVQSATEEEIEWIIDNVLKMERFFILNKINDIVLSYSTTLLLFIANWNDNTLRDSRIKESIERLSSIIDGSLTLRETIRINKIILQELNRYKEYKPVAYESARHFEDNINEEIKRGNILNERGRKS